MDTSVVIHRSFAIGGSTSDASTELSRVDAELITRTLSAFGVDGCVSVAQVKLRDLEMVTSHVASAAGERRSALVALDGVLADTQRLVGFQSIATAVVMRVVVGASALEDVPAAQLQLETEVRHLAAASLVALPLRSAPLRVALVIQGDAADDGSATRLVVMQRLWDNALLADPLAQYAVGRGAVVFEPVRIPPTSGHDTDGAVASLRVAVEVMHQCDSAFKGSHDAVVERPHENDHIAVILNHYTRRNVAVVYVIRGAMCAGQPQTFTSFITEAVPATSVIRQFSTEEVEPTLALAPASALISVSDVGTQRGVAISRFNLLCPSMASSHCAGAMLVVVIEILKCDVQMQMRDADSWPWRVNAYGLGGCAEAEVLLAHDGIWRSGEGRDVSTPAGADVVTLLVSFRRQQTLWAPADGSSLLVLDDISRNDMVLRRRNIIVGRIVHSWKKFEQFTALQRKGLSEANVLAVLLRNRVEELMPGYRYPESSLSECWAATVAHMPSISPGDVANAAAVVLARLWIDELAASHSDKERQAATPQVLVCAAKLLRRATFETYIRWIHDVLTSSLTFSGWGLKPAPWVTVAPTTPAVGPPHLRHQAQSLQELNVGFLQRLAAPLMSVHRAATGVLVAELAPLLSTFDPKAPFYGQDDTGQALTDELIRTKCWLALVHLTASVMHRLHHQLFGACPMAALLETLQRSEQVPVWVLFATCLEARRAWAVPEAQQGFRLLQVHTNASCGSKAFVRWNNDARGHDLLHVLVLRRFFTAVFRRTRLPRNVIACFVHFLVC
jgi:hypothetical protein